MKSLMKDPFACSSLALVAVLAGCASQGGVHPSPYYANVTKHLDVGGKVLLYADVDGDVSAGATYLDGLLARARKAYPDATLERVQVKHIAEQLGLDRILAVGLSSSQDGKAYHNKTFIQYGDPRRGILLLTGAPPHAPELPRLAPADADIAFESDLKIKSLVDLIQSIANDIAGDKAKALFAGLDEKVTGTALTWRQLVDRLDTRLVGVLRVDDARAFAWPGADKKVIVPGVDLLLAVDNLAIVFDAFVGMARSFPGVTSTTEDGIAWIEFDPQLPGAPWLKPVFAKHEQSGRIYLSTGKAFVKECLSDKPSDKKSLANTADFKRATAGFMDKSNGLSYMSGAFIDKVVRFVRPLGKDDKDFETGLDLIVELLPENGIPFAAQQVSLPDGLLYASYATTSHKSTLAPALLAGPAVIVGMGAAAYLANLRRSLHVPSAHDQGAPSPIENPEPATPALAPSSEPDPNATYRVDIDDAPVRGPADALVTIVQFSDFQCPFCRRVEPTLKQLLAEYKKDVRLVWRDFPLKFHKRAKAAAIAARAAGAQGKFWEMHDALLAGRGTADALSDDSLLQIARDIKLDIPSFQAALLGDKLAKGVEADLTMAHDLGLRGAPAFFINGRYLSGARPLKEFKSKVDEALQAARKRVAHGTPRKKLYRAIMDHAVVVSPIPPEPPLPPGNKPGE